MQLVMELCDQIRAFHLKLHVWLTQLGRGETQAFLYLCEQLKFEQSTRRLAAFQNPKVTSRNKPKPLKSVVENHRDLSCTNSSLETETCMPPALEPDAENPHGAVIKIKKTRQLPLGQSLEAIR